MRAMLISAVAGFCAVAAGSAAAQSDWKATIFKGGQSATDETSEYVPLPAKSATKKWHLCVAFPHMKDAYYVAKTYGVDMEAKRQGVTATVLEAGGYNNVTKQISQIEDCVTQGGNAVLVNAVSKGGLVKLVEELDKKGVPVIDMGNGLDSPLIKARTRAEYKIAGKTAGAYLAKLHPKGSGKQKLVWLAGPPGSQWVEDAVAGMKEAIAGSDVELAQVMYGDTGKEVQMKLIDDALQTYPDVKLIGGVAPAIEGAMQILREKNRTDIKLISFYTTPSMEDGVKQGRILGTVSDAAATGSRISVDQAIRILEKKPFIEIAARQFEMIDQSNVKTYDRETMLAPGNYKPEFNIR
jgi:periplasmic protein TorT